MFFKPYFKNSQLHVDLPRLLELQAFPRFKIGGGIEQKTLSLGGVFAILPALNIAKLNRVTLMQKKIFFNDLTFFVILPIYAASSLY
ncbi:MAG: hypothetical protein KA436_10485 [Oligoflexales bacterium]|nr:hypothetical protein [Oligoflexales bacterium]